MKALRYQRGRIVAFFLIVKVDVTLRSCSHLFFRSPFFNEHNLLLDNVLFFMAEELLGRIKTTELFNFQDQNQSLNSTVMALSSRVGSLQVREEELSSRLQLKVRDWTFIQTLFFRKFLMMFVEICHTVDF